jgi:membrane protease YdiL (CAAX protease family)
MIGTDAETRSPRGRRALGLVRALSWCVVAYAGLQLGLAGVALLSGPSEWVLWLFGAVEVVVVGGLALLLFIAEPHDPAPVRSDSTIGRQLWLGFWLGVLMKIPADSLRALIDVYWPTPDAELQAQAELLRHDTWLQVSCLIVVVGVLGPIVEEAFYRGAVFGSFRRALGRAGAILLSSVVFALSHASPRDWLPLTLVALGIGIARVRTAALWAGMAAHVAFNLGALGLLFVGREIDVTRGWWWGVLALGCLGASVLLLRRMVAPRPVLAAD